MGRLEVLRTGCRPRMPSGLGGRGVGRGAWVCLWGVLASGGGPPRRSLLPDVWVPGAGWLWVSALLLLRAEATARDGSSPLRCSPPPSQYGEKVSRARGGSCHLRASPSLAGGAVSPQI